MKITIIGLGLIGGSMALDLKKRGVASALLGVEQDPENARKALELGLVDQVLPFQEAIQTDLVIVATPVNVILKLLPEVMDRIGDHTVVMDVGSTKEQICKTILKHPRRKQFVATHPIAGTENSGPEAALSGLFDQKLSILCADESALWAVERASEVYEALNMNLIFMNAADHDMHVAYVSHISHISSFALATTVLEIEKNTARIFDLAGSGFASTVRLAKSSPDMWAPIFAQNSKYISKALGTYIKHLQRFKKQIDSKNTRALHETMKKANSIRKVLDKK